MEKYNANKEMNIFVMLRWLSKYHWCNILYGNILPCQPSLPAMLFGYQCEQYGTPLFHKIATKYSSTVSYVRSYLPSNLKMYKLEIG